MRFYFFQKYKYNKHSLHFLGIHLFSLLFFLNISLTVYSQETISTKNIELLRVGQQLNITIKFQSIPAYEEHENLSEKVLLIKFKNARLASSNGKKDLLYNDPILEGLRFTQEDNEVWVIFKARTPDLTYDIAQGTPPGIFKVEFRKKVKVDPLEPPPVPPSLRLKTIRFGNHPPEYSRSTFHFVHSKEPRMFFRQDKDKKVTTIRFSDTHPIDNFPDLFYKDGRILFDKNESLTTDPNQTFVIIESTTGPLDVKTQFLLDPPRWVIDFYGEPDQETAIEVIEKTEDKELTEEEVKALEEEAERKRIERIRKSNRDNLVKNSYNQAEAAFRQGAYDQSLVLFLQTYKLAKSFQIQFDEPFHPLGIQSLFRRADAIYEILQRSQAKNYHKAISEYNTAIRIAEDNNLVTDLLPYAYLQIGLSYRTMKFYDDANQIFDTLQRKYPDTLQAAEANFWRAVGQVDRQEWRAAINSFRDYLRAGASPAHLAAAHYKMAEAFYNLRQYSKAREGFDRARNIDINYPETDPALLFHMGEAYYETADFATAREMFRILLNRYPDADFSKLVALRLGDFLREEGKEEEAIAIYRKAASSFKQELALLGQMRIANIQAQRPYSNDYQNALTIYENIANLPIESPIKEEAVLRKGLTLTLFAQYREAIEALEEFSQNYPNNIYVRRKIIQENIDENLKGLIDQYFEQEDYLGIVGIYQEFRQKYLARFSFDTTLFQVGVAYFELGFFDDAIDIFKFISSNSTSPLTELSSFQEAVALLEKGDTIQAREALVRFILEYPNSLYHADANMKLAEVSKERREYLDAIQVYQEAIRQYTRDKEKSQQHGEVVPELYFELGNLFNELGRHSEAEQAYDQVSQFYKYPIIGEIGSEVPYYVAASHFLKADMFFELKQDLEALQSYQETIAMYESSTHPEIVNLIDRSRYKTGVIYQRTEQQKKALAIFKKLMQTGSNEIWKNLATENHNLLARRLEYQDYLQQ